MTVTADPTGATSRQLRAKGSRLYKCIQSTKQRRQKDQDGKCVNRKIPRPVIEQLVVDALVDQLLQPHRVTSILLAHKARRYHLQASADRRIIDLAR